MKYLRTYESSIKPSGWDDHSTRKQSAENDLKHIFNIASDEGYDVRMNYDHGDSRKFTISRDVDNTDQDQFKATVRNILDRIKHLGLYIRRDRWNMDMEEEHLVVSLGRRDGDNILSGNNKYTVKLNLELTDIAANCVPYPSGEILDYIMIINGFNDL